MKSNTIKTLAAIVLLSAAVTVPYIAEASTPTNNNLEQTVEDDIVKGTVIGVDEEKISCYKGTREQMTALSTFYYEILTVKIANGDTLKFLAPHSTEYEVGESFQEKIVPFFLFRNYSVHKMIQDYSGFSGAIQSTPLKVNGVIER